MNCSICKEEIKGDVVFDKDGNPKVVNDNGHNAAPVNDGRCCDECNYKVVIPARLGMLTLKCEHKNTYVAVRHVSGLKLVKCRDCNEVV